MAPPRGTKRKSDETVAASDQVEDAMTARRVATKAGSPSTQAQDSSRKRQKTGISMSQKQTLIDNLQLEITERARKLRAQYNLQAQGLRTRIEIRVNRIPMALRRAKMGELADKHKTGQHPQQVKPTPSFSVSHSSRPPTVPEKDTPLGRPASIAAGASCATTSSRPGPGRPPKRIRFEATLPSPIRIHTNTLSNEISGNGKENSVAAIESDGPKKKARGNPAVEAEATKVSKVLSPASANIRPMARPTPGGKPNLTRSAPAPAPENAPGPSRSPVKQSSTTNLFSNWAEKARSTRKDAGVKRGNASTSTTASSATGSVRGRKPGTASATGTTKGPATATAPRFSGISESSEGSTSTVVKGAKKAAEKTAAPTTKRAGVMSTIRRGVTGGTKKTAATKATKTTPASTATGRVLRRRKD